MAVERFTANVNNIQALPDEPNLTDGLSAAELKAKFDQAGSDIKDYLNRVVAPALDTVDGRGEETEEGLAELQETVRQLGFSVAEAKGTANEAGYIASEAGSAANAAQASADAAMAAAEAAQSTADGCLPLDGGQMRGDIIMGKGGIVFSGADIYPGGRGQLLVFSDGNGGGVRLAGVKAPDADDDAVNKEYLEDRLEGKQDTLSPAQMQKISNAVDAAYVQGQKQDVLNVVGQGLTALDGRKQDKLTAGSGITITNNVISATGGGGGGLTPEQEAKLNAAVDAAYVQQAIEDAIGNSVQIARDILEVL